MKAVLGSVWGAVIGVAAGLIGVGGGEFRIPVLIHILRFPIRVAAGANTIIGLVVVVVGVWRRWQSIPDDLTLAGMMSGPSIVGAAVGAAFADRVPTKPLKNFVCVYLLVVGTWMLIEAFSHTEHVLLIPTGMTSWILGAVFGFLIALISGCLGVAGGEMRIPTLLYLFGLPIKEAGTISLLVSIPTVAASAVSYYQFGHIPKDVLHISILMGIASVLGVLAGAAAVPYVNQHTLKGLLGLILILATVRLTAPVGSDQRADFETQ